MGPFPAYKGILVLFDLFAGTAQAEGLNNSFPGSCARISTTSHCPQAAASQHRCESSTPGQPFESKSLCWVPAGASIPIGRAGSSSTRRPPAGTDTDG